MMKSLFGTVYALLSKCTNLQLLTEQIQQCVRTFTHTSFLTVSVFLLTPNQSLSRSHFMANPSLILNPGPNLNQDLINDVLPHTGPKKAKTVISVAVLRSLAVNLYVFDHQYQYHHSKSPHTSTHNLSHTHKTDLAEK